MSTVGKLLPLLTLSASVLSDSLRMSGLPRGNLATQFSYTHAVPTGLSPDRPACPADSLPRLGDVGVVCGELVAIGAMGLARMIVGAVVKGVLGILAGGAIAKVLRTVVCGIPIEMPSHQPVGPRPVESHCHQVAHSTGGLSTARQSQAHLGPSVGAHDLLQHPRPSSDLSSIGGLIVREARYVSPHSATLQQLPGGVA